MLYLAWWEVTWTLAFNYEYLTNEYITKIISNLCIAQIQIDCHNFGIANMLVCVIRANIFWEDLIRQMYKYIQKDDRG